MWTRIWGYAEEGAACTGARFQACFARVEDLLFHEYRSTLAMTTDSAPLPQDLCHLMNKNQRSQLQSQVVVGDFPAQVVSHLLPLNVNKERRCSRNLNRKKYISHTTFIVSMFPVRTDNVHLFWGERLKTICFLHKFRLTERSLCLCRHILSN